METDDLFKESEPDANEIMFGQRTLPDRPLTAKEESKRKKVIMKLVDQKLKIKLIELMGHQVRKQSQHSEKTASPISTISQSKFDSLATNSSSSYQSQQNWFAHSSYYAEPNWPLQYPAEWRSPIYHPPRYGTIAETSWNNNCSFQPNIQHFHQTFNSNKSIPQRRVQQNTNLIRPVVSAPYMGSNAANNTSTKISVHRTECSSSLISVRTKNISNFIYLTVYSTRRVGDIGRMHHFPMFFKHHFNMIVD